MAVLADIHEKLPAALLPSLRAHAPSLILVPGDFVYGNLPTAGLKMEGSPLLPFFRTCCEIAPTFISLGNHEWMLNASDLDLITATGATVLDNSWIELDGLVIGGLSSARVTEYQSFLNSGVEAETFTVNPLYLRFHSALSRP